MTRAAACSSRKPGDSACLLACLHVVCSCFLQRYPTRTITAAAGDHHCLLLDGSGCVWAMGSNRHGQLGLSSAQQAAAAAVEATAPAAAAGGEDAAAAEDLQEQQIGSFVAVLGPGSGSSVQVQVQQVRRCCMFWQLPT
jgi:hypothetical protein